MSAKAKASGNVSQIIKVVMVETKITVVSNVTPA